MRLLVAIRSAGLLLIATSLLTYAAIALATAEHLVARWATPVQIAALTTAVTVAALLWIALAPWSVDEEDEWN